MPFTLPDPAHGMNRVKPPPGLAGKDNNVTVTEVSMTEKLKPSKYNHFVDAGDGKRLAFNAMSCGLAEIDD